MALSGEWLQAQYSVLGSVLISPEVTPRVMRETAETDFQGECRTVYKAMRKLFLDGRVIDPVAVLHEAGSGYKEFIVQLMQVTPTAANIETYCTLCRQQARVFRLQELGRLMSEEDSPEKLQQLLEKANAAMAEKSASGACSMADALKSFMGRHVGEPKYLRWPIKELDKEVYAKPGKFLIFGGLPSAGKTAWAMQCAWFWAKDYKVGFFSLETDADTLFDRQMAALSDISLADIKNNRITGAQWDRIAQLSIEITERKLDIIPAAGYTPAEVRAKTVMEGYEIIFVDYLQLLQCPGNNRTEQVTQISIALHTLAQSLGVMVVALSQLNRESGQGSRSEMSRLRESGQIEQDADVIMLLSLEDESKPSGCRILSVAKNKEGERFKMLLNFAGRHQTFSKADMSKDMLKKMVAEGKRAQRINKQTAEAERMDQMEILPDDTPTPFG